jgi:ankyrin repeat protein
VHFKVGGVDERTTLATWEECLENGFDPNEPFQSGIMPLYSACLRQDEDITFLLLRYGARVNQCNKDARRDFPIHACAMTDSTRIAEILMQNGARLDVCNATGATPLYVAAENGNISSCQQYLLSDALLNIL